MSSGITQAKGVIALDNTIQTVINNGSKNVSATSTITTAPATTDDISNLGIWGYTMAPSGATTAAIGTGLMRRTTGDSTGGAWTGTSHAIAGFDHLVLQGVNNILQSFCHESRIDQNNTGTINEMAFYKAAMTVNAGTVTTLVGLDVPDMTGVGTVTNRICINVRDALSYANLAGGYRTNVKSVGTATYTLLVTDSGKVVPVLAGQACTITLPVSFPAGMTFTVIQADANRVTFASDGSSVLVNRSTHTKTADTYSVVQLDTIATGVYVLSGATGA